MTKPYAAYVIALTLTALAVLLRLLLDPLMGDAMPLVTLFGPVAAAVWFGGYRPALVAVVLGYLACNVLFIPPRGMIGLPDAATVTGAVAYLVTCGIIIGLGEAMRRAHTQFSAETAALARLHELSSQLWRSRDLRDGLDRILAAAIELVGAERGDLQLLDPVSGKLTIAVHRGLPREFLELFREVSADDDTACARALRSGARVVIEDVELDASFAPFREIARAAGFRSVQSTPLMSGDATPLGVLSTHRQTPHRPNAQSLRRLDLYARQAADFIERHSIEEALRASERRLRDTDRRKDEFLALLAHELRNPLAPIRNSLTVLHAMHNDDEVAANARKMMERQLEQMVRLIDDLVDVSRITRGTLELRRERVELTSVVHTAVGSCQPMIDRSAQRLTLQVPSEPLYVDADPVRLAQILYNVLGNASKFTPRGGAIALTAERDGDDVVVSVRDSGVGIPTDKLDSVFDLFSQVKSPLVESQGGLGVGLNLVKQLVELHGGRVVVRSGGEGQGSEFLIRLPILTDSTVPAPARTPEAIIPATRRHRILIVDDNRDSADSMAMLLVLSGHETRVAYNGQEALTAAGEYQPDVVLLDIGLPKIDGYEVCGRLRQAAWARETTIIALTGWGHAEDRRKSREAGFDGHLVKPADHSSLMKVLESRHPKLALSTREPL